MLDTRRRLAKLLWVQLAAAKNPWFDGAASETKEAVLYRKWSDWNLSQMALCQALFDVGFKGAPPDEDLLRRALDFLDG